MSFGNPASLNNYRGTRNPPRGKCPDCGKKGLSTLKIQGGSVGRNCRYCGVFIHVNSKGEFEENEL